MPDDTEDTVFNQAATTKRRLRVLAPLRPCVAFSTVLACFLVAPAANAMEGGDVAGHPLTVDVTETAVFNYNFDNRNDDPTDDDWGTWLNRLNVQASWYRLVLGVRVDSSMFFQRPDPNALAQEDLARREPPLPGEIQDPPNVFLPQRTGEYGRDLSNRYLNTVYPSKMYLSYAAPNVEATVGDLYAQFGRGLVLSVRKIDELAVDTTIRGGKISYRVPMPEGSKLKLIGLGGYMNPLRVDESSGRVLQSPSAWIFAGMPQPQSTSYLPDPTPSFVPDRLVGASIEGGLTAATLGVHGVLLDRPALCGLPNAPENCTPYVNQYERGAHQVRNVSSSLALPNIYDHGSFYVEVAAQQQRNPSAVAGQTLGKTSVDDVNGYAVYSAISGDAGPMSLTVEGKHYRKFYPLSANIDADGMVNEFSLVQYSAPPTTLPVYVDTESNFFNICVSGGRGRLDARATDDLLVYGWVGRYASWSESGSVDCDIDAKNRNDIWDTAVGVEALFEKKRSHAFLSVGARDDQLAQKRDTAAPTSEVYYREGYVRYDLVKALTPTLYLQVQGTVRRRHDESKTPIPWWEGENYTGLQWSPHLSVAFGYEYLTAAGHPGSYYNGAVKWRIDPDKSLRLFVGQQRGALRCISGVCREFPAFEGAKAEAVVRF